MWFWIITAERLTATAEGCGEMRDGICALFRWKEVAAGARMPVLAVAFAASALALLIDWGVKPLQSLDGGLEEFLELRPICSSSWAT